VVIVPTIAVNVGVGGADEQDPRPADKLPQYGGGVA
jgi:hypothetical protein